MDQVFWNNPVSAWVWAGLTAFLTFLILQFLTLIGKKQVQKSENPLITMRLLSQLRWYSRVAVALWAGSYFLNFPGELARGLRVLLIAILAIQIGSWLGQFINLISDRELSRVPIEDLSRRSSIRGIAMAARVLVWLIILLVILESIPNLSVVGIITSLGLGGIAIGLAAQSFVSDLLSSLTIRLDKPFEIGETIKTGDFTGKVERISLKSTTLRSITGEALTIGNSALLTNPLQNFSRMTERFQVFSILLSSDTPQQVLKQLPSEIEAALNAIELVRFERARLKGFNPTSLDFEVAYTVTSPLFVDFVRASHEVNLAILELITRYGLRPGMLTLTLPEESKGS